MNNETVGKITIENAAYSAKEYLYGVEFTYMDLAADENGLWVIYAAEQEPNSLLVSKILPDEMRLEKTWNISVVHRSYSEGFIVCGVLYLVQNTTDPSTMIEFAYDLYEKQFIEVLSPLKFLNPFQQTTMIAYNPSDVKLYTWDKGNQLVYPLLLS